MRFLCSGFMAKRYKENPMVETSKSIAIGWQVIGFDLRNEIRPSGFSFVLRAGTAEAMCGRTGGARVRQIGAADMSS